ncbi:MAG TPA: asparaginase [Streptosporangiaceae bacterium]|nr:asparaginase [Streptosporangiaceae bacterium]
MVLAEVIRSGFAESRHRGALAVLGPGGQVVLRAGGGTTPLFPRSANKPLQAAGMLQAGLRLDGPLLALAAASHSGEPFHIAGVHQILAGAGLAEDALQCPPGLPLDDRAQLDYLREGGRADRIHMNCSGKHAAMLATCAAAGWPAASYLEPAHPLQQQIRHTVESLSGETVTAVGVDGCGAPLFALSLTGLARAYQSMVRAAPGSAGRQVADCMRAYPDWTAGTNRPESALMTAVPGLLVKAGAEGVLAFALGDGWAAAIKIEDGAGRALPALAVALLRGLRADVLASADAAALDRIASVPVHGGGRIVGHVRAVLPGGPPPG